VTRRRAAESSAIGSAAVTSASVGAAVGTASALPISLKALQNWIQTLDSRGLVLVPISAVASQG